MINKKTIGKVFIVVAIGMLLGACGSQAGAELADDVALANTVAAPKESYRWTDPATGTQYEIDSNRRVLASGAEARPGERREIASVSHTWLPETFDRSGTISVQITVCTTSPAFGSISAGCTVDDNRVLVGGGAFDSPGQGIGALLWESRPQEADSSGNRTAWLASSKDHYYPVSHALTVYAVGLRLQMPNGQFMPRDTLKQLVHYKKTVGTVAAHSPTTTCVLDDPNDYLIGGGAKAIWSGAGQLLTNSVFSSDLRGWVATSKDHGYSDIGTVDAYCIGIPYTIPGYGELYPKYFRDFGVSVDTGRAEAVANRSTSLPLDGVLAAVTCYGGDGYFSGAGRLLYGMGPIPNDPSRFSTMTKDHIYVSGGRASPVAVGLYK